MGVWWDEKQGQIHLTAPGVNGFHTTISPNPESKRGHPNLFMKLAKALREGGAPHPLIERNLTMPIGPRGEKRPPDVIGASVVIGGIASRDAEDPKCKAANRA